jgi:hypothetical protein
VRNLIVPISVLLAASVGGCSEFDKLTAKFNDATGDSYATARLEARAADQACESERTMGIYKTHAQVADCVQTAVVPIFTKANYPYMDLVYLYLSAKRVAAKKTDRHLVGEDDADSQLTDLGNRIRQQEQQRTADNLSSTSAQITSDDRALLNGLPALYWGKVTHARKNAPPVARAEDQQSDQSDEQVGQPQPAAAPEPRAPAQAERDTQGDQPAQVQPLQDNQAQPASDEEQPPPPPPQPPPPSQTHSPRSIRPPNSNAPPSEKSITGANGSVTVGVPALIPSANAAPASTAVPASNAASKSTAPILSTNAPPPDQNNASDGLHGNWQ